MMHKWEGTNSKPQRSVKVKKRHFLSAVLVSASLGSVLGHCLTSKSVGRTSRLSSACLYVHFPRYSVKRCSSPHNVNVRMYVHTGFLELHII